MKYFYLLTLTIIVSSCSLFKSTYYNEYVVTVIDEYKSIPIDSAEVKLVILKNNVDLIVEIFYTNSSGKCVFKIASPIPIPNHLVISKSGYDKYLSLNDEEHTPWYISINEKTPKELTYSLTSDTLNHYKYFKTKRPRYEMDELIEILGANQFPQQKMLPQLHWEDIPKLLEFGMDTTIINRYPVNPFSSMTSFDCYLGNVTLWYIEIIRLNAKKGEFNLQSIYPSQTPTLHYSGEFPYSNKELMNQAYIAYYSWWQKVKHLNRNEACKIDPLENTKVHWQKDLSPSSK